MFAKTALAGTSDVQLHAINLYLTLKGCVRSVLLHVARVNGYQGINQYAAIKLLLQVHLPS